VSLTLLVSPLFTPGAETVPFVLFVFLAGTGGLTGALGALVAQKLAPRNRTVETGSETAPVGHGEMNRAALLDQMFALQRQLAAQKRRAAFVSVDVVGSSAIKQAARTTGDELAVEHAFVQYHRWVEQIVCAHGGRVHATAGDGVMCLFDEVGGPSGASPELQAVRAARELQTRLAAFNEAQQDCLSTPLRIRCGVSAGEVAIEPGVPVGHLQSAVIDRAAALQKRAAPGDIVVDHETAVTALTELGALAPLPFPTGSTTERAFSWQAAIASRPVPSAP
jgi:class 3 adenylate cyclase